MRVKVVVENSSMTKEYKKKHGLSLYVEIEQRKILFDLGPDETLLENSKAMGIDLGAIDMVVISHGHKDHGGALELFLKQNQKAKVYIQEEAFVGHYTKVLGVPIKIGLDEQLKRHSQVVLVNEPLQIDEQLLLFAGREGNRWLPQGNQSLYKKEEGGYEHDDFVHEMGLIIVEDNKQTLIAGCAHGGIVNIIEKAEAITGSEIDYVLSGFHLFNPVSKKMEDEEMIKEVGNALKEKRCRCFTGHCTGEKAYGILKAILGNQLDTLSTGKGIML